MDNKPEDGSLSWQEQRQEAIRRQQDRWRQLHPQQQQQQEHPVQPQQQQQQQQNPSYPTIPPAHAAGPLLHYPDIPAPSAPPFDAAAEHASAADADRQRRQQQEEEDHRLAMQLQEQFAAEDDAPAGSAGQHQGLQDTPMAWEGMGSEDEDDWEAIARTASMGRMGGTGQGTGPMGQHAAAASARPTSQAAAAAGSTAGSVIGAGLSALLAMAAQAAANRAQQAAAAGGGDGAAGAGEARTSQGTSAAGQHDAGSSAAAQHTAAAGTGAAAGGGGGGGNSSSGGGSGGDGGGGVLNMAANALRSFLASRAAANQAGSSAAAAAGSTGHQNEEERRWEDEQPAPEDLEMLQNMLQSLMGGTLPPGLGANRNQPPGAAPPAAAGAQAGSTGVQRGGASSGSGFRMTRLPGGGFSATYSSSSSGPGSSSSWQVHSSTSHSSGSGDPFAGMMGGVGDVDPMFGGPDDFLSQLLLAGARSARDTPGRAGYTHYDPRSGDAQFEPMGGAAGAAGMGLEALLSQLMGPGLFGGGGGGPMSYEDLVGLSDVQVTTPEEVLSSLPHSKYVEGRKPGDSDTCVICQTVYSAGDDLTHLPCLHAFHKDCISPWLSGHSRKCPVCKTDVC